MLFDEDTREFAERVDLESLRRLAVYDTPRLVPLDTYARDRVSTLYGDATPEGLDPVFAYFEFLYRPGAYLDKPVIYVRSKAMREYLARHLPPEMAETFRRTRRLPPVALADQSGLLKVIQRRGTREQIAAAGDIPSLRPALAALDARPELRVPLERLQMRYEAFIGLDEDVLVARFIRERYGRFGRFNAPVQRRWVHDWYVRLLSIETAWRKRNAPDLDKAASDYLTHQRTYSGNRKRFELEIFYNRTYRFSIVWINFAVAVVLWVLAVAIGRPGKVRAMAVLLLWFSTAALAAGIGVRWRLSGRAWHLPPILNQYEAVMASALLAGLAGCVLELLAGRRARRGGYPTGGLFGLAASLYAFAALLACFLLPGRMGAAIEMPPGILASPIMAAHVATIIIGHALVGMTVIVSAVYLVSLAVGAVAGEARASETPVAPGGEASETGSHGGGAWAVSAGADLGSGPAVGWLASVDRCNLVLVQLAGWLVLVGTVLGAVWADFAWGRFWGWDRKETWALITALVYVAVVHLRYVVPARHRGWATAGGCLLGGGAMLFNWIAVNYLLPGLHSYA